ncbi:MAG: cation diffusion facilitator family transporter [Hyphomicrobiaceae bacterium]
MTDERAKITYVALASVLVALAAMGVKYLAYVKTGSVALYSDALEGIVNVITGLLAVVAVRISARPPDRHHQFGHHKAEYFSAVVEGVLILIAAGLILREAWDAVHSPRQLSEPWLGLLISGAATALNGAWATFLIRWGGIKRSPALVADGRHIMTDVATSVGVIVGLLMAQATGWPLLDPLLAAAVAINILWTGWRLTQSSMSSLMDEAVGAAELERIRAAITKTSSGLGAIEVHDLRTRHAGPISFIEFHLVVPGDMTVAESHRICDLLETAIGQSIDGAEVLIHVEPEDEAGRRGRISL